MVGDAEELGMSYASFENKALELPSTREGFSNLIIDTFWELVALGMSNPKSVTNPAPWAESQLSHWISTFFEYNEEYVESYDYDQTKDLLTTLVGQAAVALNGLEPTDTGSERARIPLLEEIDKAGPHNPIIRGLIRRDFGPLAAEVTKARIAVLVKKTASNETVTGRFGQLASLTSYEVKRLLRLALRPERKIGVSRRIAGELVGGRCALDVNTVLKYAQPGRPKANRKKQK